MGLVTRAGGASRLLAQSGRGWSQASFEYRAVHDVLALTLLFTCQGAPQLESSHAWLDTVTVLTTHDVEWAVWCQERLDGDPRLADVDKELATDAFRSLAASRLVGGLLDETLDALMVIPTYPGVGLSIGVSIAQRMFDERGRRFRSGS